MSIMANIKRTKLSPETMGIFRYELGWCGTCETCPSQVVICMSHADFLDAKKLEWTDNVCGFADISLVANKLHEGTFTPVSASFAAEWKAKKLDQGSGWIEYAKLMLAESSEDKADDEGQEAKPN
jgi:hypothetical protein